MRQYTYKKGAKGEEYKQDTKQDRAPKVHLESHQQLAHALGAGGALLVSAAIS